MKGHKTRLQTFLIYVPRHKLPENCCANAGYSSAYHALSPFLHLLPEFLEGVTLAAKRVYPSGSSFKGLRDILHKSKVDVLHARLGVLDDHLSAAPEVEAGEPKHMYIAEYYQWTGACYIQSSMLSDLCMLHTVIDVTYSHRLHTVISDGHQYQESSNGTRTGSPCVTSTLVKFLIPGINVRCV